MQRGRKRTAASSGPVLAKLTRPALSGVYPRTRLFRLLERASRSPVVWISAPAGAGKTTLLASYLQARRRHALWYQMDAGDSDVGSFFYHMGMAFRAYAARPGASLPLLTSEYREGLSAFTTNYFRELFGRLKPPGIAVIDNFQEAHGEAIEETWRLGFEQITPGMTVVVLSREEPAPSFASLRASGRIAILGWDDLKLTASESIAIARLRGKSVPSRTALNNIHLQTQGWVAGLVLMTEQADVTAMEHPRAGEFASQTIFDYFANEIFRRMESTTRQFLLETIFFPKISLPLVNKLMGGSDNEAILNDLTRRNYFTVRHADGSYEYHPLFRAFLLNRARAVYTPSHIKELKQRTAALLAQSGDAETAVALLQEAEDWPAAMRLVVDQARSMHAQGRSQTLERWLRNFPRPVLVEDPWALYWLGVCRMPFAPAEAKNYFEEAFVLFEQKPDALPLYLAWMRIIDCILLGWNDFTLMYEWLNRYRTLKSGRTPPGTTVEKASVFTYVHALTHARTDHHDLPLYVARAERLFWEETDPTNQLPQAAVLISHYLWKGEVSKVGGVAERLALRGGESGPPSLVQLLRHVWESWHSALTGSPDDSMQKVTEGLALADATGIHVMDSQLLSHGILSQLLIGNMAAARELLRRMSQATQQGQLKEANYHHYTSLVALHEGNVASAIDGSRRAVDAAKARGLYVGTVTFLICLAYAYTRADNIEMALKVLTEARARAIAMRSERYVWVCALCEADIHRRRGDRTAALAALREVLALAKKQSFITPSYCPRDTAAVLYAMALDADIETEHVRTIIAKTRLPPPKDSFAERWPWPIRIYTLGRFAILKDDVALSFAGKAQKKPIELLRGLIILGGRNVDVTKIAQMLWPDAEGDMAEQAFRTTLHRLRKVLGEKALLSQEGLLTLNPDYCWLDVWAFDRLIEAGDAALPLDVRAARLSQLYQGAFLSDDNLPWVILERERLRAKFTRAIAQHGQALEALGRGSDAALLYERAIDAEPLAEDLYLRLMHCYRRLCRPVEALAVYQRCHTALTRLLRTEPSAPMKVLYGEIRGETA